CGSGPNNAPARLPLTRTSRPDSDVNPLRAVVAEPRQVPRRLQRLHMACFIGRPAGELVLTRCGRPHGAPSPPAQVAGRLENGVLPEAVDRPFDPRDRGAARPGTPRERDLAGIDDAAPRIEVRNTRR